MFGKNIRGVGQVRACLHNRKWSVQSDFGVLVLCVAALKIEDLDRAHALRLGSLYCGALNNVLRSSAQKFTLWSTKKCDLKH
jgi:hypothetical protein